LLSKIIAGEELPEGTKGIFFAETGRASWKEVAMGVAEALYKLNAIKTQELSDLSIAEVVVKWARGSELVAELGFASK
jgi:hypothetical protein